MSFLFPCLSKPLVPGDRIFDAHCHVFNLEYLALESGQIIYDMLRGAYPRAGWDERGNSITLLPELEGKTLVDDAERLLAWILEIGIAAFGSEAGNASRLRSAAEGQWHVKNLNLIPLMMDIYYLYAPPLRESGAPRVQAAPSAMKASAETANMEAEFLSRLTRAARKAIGADSPDFDKKAVKALRGAGFALDAEGLEGIAARIASRIASRISGGASPESADTPSFARTAGFRAQFEAVRELGKPGTGMYPFFAFDPRREGAIDWIVNSGLVGRGGPFYGVKLYPRLGVHPRCPELDALYAFCEDNSVPIASHASYAGFPDWVASYADFGNPLNFEPALRAHQGLKIDVAHFGDRTDLEDDWGDEIAGLMARYPGAYSDLACFTRQESIDKFKTRYMDLPNVRERTMFGSDFDVMYFTRPGITLGEYYASFLAAFGPEALGKMACEVPKEFLGL